MSLSIHVYLSIYIYIYKTEVCYRVKLSRWWERLDAYYKAYKFVLHNALPSETFSC